MIASIYARVVVVLVCLLAPATSAWAECAWVLWLGTGSGYAAFGAYGGNTGEKDCKEAAAQLMTNMSKDAKQLSDSQIEQSVSVSRTPWIRAAEGDEMIKLEEQSLSAQGAKIKPACRVNPDAPVAQVDRAAVS